MNFIIISKRLFKNVFRIVFIMQFALISKIIFYFIIIYFINNNNAVTISYLRTERTMAPFQHLCLDSFIFYYSCRQN